MSQDYPVTRAQAAKWLRQGERLEVPFKTPDGRSIEVMVKWRTFDKGIKARLWSGPGVYWTTLSWKQLLGFIRRNYVRSYLSMSEPGA